MSNLNWYRVTFTTNSDQPVEWEIYLAATTAERAKETAELLWQSGRGPSRLSNLKASRVKTTDGNIRAYEFNRVSSTKQEEAE